MGVINQITDTNGTTHDVQGIHRVIMNNTSSTATAFVVNTVTGESVTSLYDGLTIVCKNTKIASASGCTLNLNGLGAKRIWTSQSNSYCTTHWGLNQTYIFIYDATNARWELQQGRDTDSNNYDRNRYNATIKAGANAIVAGNIIVADSDGKYHHLKDGTAFNLRYPILYAAAAIEANGTGSDNYDCIAFTVTTTQSITLTPYKPVYIACTMGQDLSYTPISTTPLTQTLPTDFDNIVYILLGIAYSSTAIYLLDDHRKYIYLDDVFGPSEFSETAGVSGRALTADYAYDAPNTTYTLSVGTGSDSSKIVLTPSSGTANKITVPYATSAGSAPTQSHTHGYINYSGAMTGSSTAIASGDCILFMDSDNSNKVTKGPSFGANEYIGLTYAGTFKRILRPYEKSETNATGTNYVTITPPASIYLDALLVVVNVNNSGTQIPFTIPCEAVTSSSSSSPNSFRSGYYQSSSSNASALIQVYHSGSTYYVKQGSVYLNGADKTSNSTTYIFYR